MIDNIIERDILDEAKDNFLTYSSEVLTDRAIPAAEDGLLSSQRKILWTMAEYLKMDHKSKTKKCNSIVGATLLTSYFHGDISCYGVLRKMSQDYLMRYPLVIPQGSLGTQEDNDMFSSSRYTEAKPSIFADVMLQDYGKDVVPKKETYTGEYMEPVILPSLFPNALCNGRQAIGISMSHSSPTHNLTEVCNAAIALIQNPEITIAELMALIPGPDFPLGGTIINSKDVKTAFETGKSRVSLKVRGDYEIKGQDIIFTTIPYRTYRNKIKDQIANNIEIFDEVISDYDDESGLGQNRLIFHVKPEVSVTKALNKLFALTDLQSTVSYNMNFIVDGTPKLLSLKQLLQAYVSHQENVLIKATEYDKAKAEARIHILEGILKALDVIDDVIARIKAANDRAAARTSLIEFLAIDEAQANAILDMKLVKLTRLDKDELVQELDEKRAFVEQCNRILTVQEVRNNTLIDRITKLRDTYGDARRTKLIDIEDDSKEKKETPKLPPEECVLVISGNSLIKRIPAKSFKAQRRNTVGTKSSDITIYSTKTNTEDILMVFSSKGKMYRLLVENIPEGTNTTNGVPITSLIEFSDSEVPMAYTTLTRDSDKKYIFFATKRGLVKKVPLTEYDKMKRTGIIALNLREGDELAAATFINSEEVIMVTKQGMTIRFETAGMPLSSRIAQGVKGINLNEDDEVLATLPIINSDDYLAIVSESGQGKRTALSEFVVQNRGGKGVSCYKGILAGATLVNESDNLLISGDKSSLVIAVSDLPKLGRTSIGNVLIKNNNKVVSISKV